MANPDYQQQFTGTYQERRARAGEKSSLILDFLWKETYSDTKTLSALLGLGGQATKLALNKLVDRGLLAGVMLSPLGFGAPTKYWGITRAGLILHRGEEAVLDCRAKHFLPSMVNAVTVRHKLAIQKAIINRGMVYRSAYFFKWGEHSSMFKNENFGYENPHHLYALRGVEQSSNLSKIKKKPVNIPDLILNIGVGVAVEVELNIKATKRYAAIFEGHYRNFKQLGLYDGVIYVLPTEKDRERFELILESVFKKALDDGFLRFFRGSVFFTSFEMLEGVREQPKNGAEDAMWQKHLDSLGNRDEYPLKRI
jgi:hypothetical protein